jgi:hypothetical protein
VSGRPAPSSEASPPRVLVVDGDARHEVFVVVDAEGDLIRARSAYLFEIGEELTVEIVQEGRVSDATARVRAHTGPDTARITELEITDRSAPRAG